MKIESTLIKGRFEVKIKPEYINSNIKFYYITLNHHFEHRQTEGFRIGKATMLDYILSIFGKEPEISLLRHIKRGDDYFLAWSNNRIASIGRICYADIKEIELGHDEALLISFITVPEFRRRGLYVSLIKSMLNYLKQNNYSKCYIWADRENTASLAGIEKAGFIPIDD